MHGGLFAVLTEIIILNCVHSRTRLIRIKIDSLYSWQINFLIMLATNAKRVNVILRRTSNGPRFSYFEIRFQIIRSRRWRSKPFLVLASYFEPIIFAEPMASPFERGSKIVRNPVVVQFSLLGKSRSFSYSKTIFLSRAISEWISHVIILLEIGAIGFHFNFAINNKLFYKII